jgi:Asp-tRNA(Asn)/Glu-tRNA(Gln) amidotransferase C subunit
MLARMTMSSLDDFRRLARTAGFDWSDQELQALLPAFERSVALLRSLDDVALGDLEPTTHYRVLS